MTSKADITKFSRKIDIDDVSADARQWRLATTESDRAAIAKRLKVEAVTSFSGEASLWREGADVILEGKVSAALERVCVVSLAPVTEQVAEHFRLRFMKKLPETFEDEPEDEDFEQLPPDTIDLADILVQQAALAMSAHPRKPDAEPPAGAGAGNEKVSPFSVLKGLVDEPSGTNS
jgi:uncharacterized metal-binding protein YceD (DUF177 family)